jgi:dsRNA-specific ribonuclease
MRPKRSQWVLDEHLEWVGDGILKGLTAGLIHSLYPEKTEGEMSVISP